jgi:hypothetical protein
VLSWDLSARSSPSFFFLNTHESFIVRYVVLLQTFFAFVLLNSFSIAALQPFFSLMLGWSHASSNISGSSYASALDWGLIFLERPPQYPCTLCQILFDLLVSVETIMLFVQFLFVAIRLVLVVLSSFSSSMSCL